MDVVSKVQYNSFQDDETDTGFRCLCAAGWSGETCGDDIDECTENDDLCQNNGICVNAPGLIRLIIFYRDFD